MNVPLVPISPDGDSFMLISFISELEPWLDMAIPTDKDALPEIVKVSSLTDLPTEASVKLDPANLLLVVAR